MAASRIVPSLDVAEDRHSGLGLRGEPAACQQLAFQCGEEALAHGVVVGVTDRPHGWAHTRLPTAAAERQRRILTTLIAVVDDVARLTLTDRHLECCQHELGSQMRLHRPADDPAAEAERFFSLWTEPRHTDPSRTHGTGSEEERAGCSA